MTTVKVTFTPFNITTESMGVLYARMDPVAKSLVHAVCEPLRRGIRPSGPAQPPNTPFTIRRKGHSISGVDTGHLSTPSSWDTDRVHPGEWHITPPSNRLAPILRLEPLDYGFVEFPMSWVPYFLEATLTQIDNLW